MSNRNAQFLKQPNHEKVKEETEKARTEKRKAKRAATLMEKRGLSLKERKVAPTAQLENKTNFTGNTNASFTVSFININKIPNKSLTIDIASDLKGDIIFMGETNPSKK